MESAPASSPRRTSALLLTFFTALIVTFLAQDAAQGGELAQRLVFPEKDHQQHRSSDDDDENVIADGEIPVAPGAPGEDEDEDAMIQALRRKLQPKKVLLNADGELAPHQFLHLHHMKTGGTSMDGLLNCGLRRLRDAQLKYNYSNIHECGESHYEQCRTGKSPSCLETVRTASVMSYCAPLQDLERPFGWEPADAIPAAVTVLRHPVHRVWSMFRFQTKGCYHCLPLKDVYAAIDSGKDSDLRHNCKMQLLNHQTRNLLSDVSDFNENPHSEEAIEQAIANMKNVFTMVGITEDMPTTAAMAYKVFPWLSPNLDWSAAVEWGAARDAAVDGKRRANANCTLPHANSSPRNNRCGKGGTHWDLPSEPDGETARLILQHNRADLQLYEAALRHFELQRRALDL